MEIRYRRIADYLPVDLERLRPAGSYRTLIQKRTHAIDGLVARFGEVPADLLIERRCPTCGSAVWREELQKDHMRIVRCAACDLVYVNPAFNEEHYRATYQSAEYQEIMRDLGEQSHDYRVERFGAERVSLMAAHLEAAHGAVPQYLDVGSSTGFVVEAAAARGWRATGLDLNPSAVRFGQARGLDLRVGTLEDAGFEPESFDAVSLFDVLEHLLFPRATLASAVRLLKPGGILFLYVPNYDSASRMLMGADAHFIWPTHHLNYYTPLTLADLTARAGLSVAMLTTEGLDFSDYIWREHEVRGADMDEVQRIADTLQFLANAGGYGKNLRMIARRT